MRVLIISKNLTGGGAERVATNLAGCLKEHVEKVILVVLNGSNNTYGTTVETIDLNMPANKGKLKILWHLQVMNKVRKIKHKYGITHSISFMAEPDLANILSRRNDKTIVSIRNNRSAGKMSGILFLKNKWVFNKADAIVALSKKVAEDMVSSYGVKQDNVTPIYNPCYIDVIKKKIGENNLSADEEELFSLSQGRIVITAGRLEDQKGQWHLIRAFSLVIREIPDAKLVILGQGSNKDYLEKLIDEMQLHNNVKMLGYKANPYPYLARSDVFAFPSIYEGLGNILIECMACELPIISADCKFGPKELLDPGGNLNSSVEDITLAEYGILLPPMDGKKYGSADPLQDFEIKLGKAIIQILSNKKLREDYRNKIKHRGSDFAPDEITKQWLAVLGKL